MDISRKRFLKLSLGIVSGLLLGATAKGAKSLLAQTETTNITETMHKVGDKVPQAGRYQCSVCKFIVEYLPKHIENGVTFGICTVCYSGTENGPKKPNEEFWKYIGQAGNGG